MRKLAVETILVILALGFLAAVLPVMADSPPPGATPDPLSAYETGDKQFKRYDIGDKTIYWHQRTIGNAIVEGDFIRYQFDRDSGTLLTKKTEWRDGLPAQLPPIIPREQAEAGIGREILHTMLYIISPDSFVHPIEPTPQNPCWVVTSADDLDIYVDIIDAVTGEYLGPGVPPPYEAFAFSGPVHILDHPDNWAEFAEFRVRNYCSPQPSWGEWGAEEQGGEPWYNTSWEYRQQGNVTSSAPCGNLSGYQMELKLHHGAGNSSGGEVFLNGSPLANFSDIRFTEGDGVTPLDYWMQGYIDGVNATVWVNFSTISTNGTRFYTYYGNPNAGPASNGSNTFIVFNDGSSLDGWSIHPAGVSYDWMAVDGVIRCNVTDRAGGWSNLYYNTPIGTDFYVAESRIRAGAGLADPNFQQGIGYGNSPMARWLESLNKWNLRDTSGSSDSAVDDTFNAHKWHEYSFIKNGTDWELFVDGVSRVTRDAAAVSQYTGVYVFMTGNPWLGLYQNAESWFKKMGYSTEAMEYPGERKLRSHVQSDQTALLYAGAHGDSMRFVSGYGDLTHCHEIHYWLENYAKIPFVFLGNCGAMCDMARGSTSYEFRKGSSDNSTAVGYNAMSLESCSNCWANSRNWQDTLFNYIKQSYTVKQAFDEANAAYPVCNECTRFIGDESLKLVPVVSRGAAGPLPTPTPSATAPPQWVSMNSGVKWGLRDVWGSSPADVFAVGERGTILRYDGISWSPMSSEYTRSLRAVWGNSSTDLFTVGTSATILHYNGSNWSLMEHNATTWFIQVLGNSSSNVFAIGDHGAVLHYNGSNWSIVADGDLERLYGAWGTSHTDIFATGVEGNIWHCNGSNWSDSGNGTTEWLTGMWGTSPSDIFAVGDHGTILHYNGINWSAMDSGTSEWLWSVWGSSSSDVFVVGTAGTVLHYNGSAWSRMSSGTSEWLYGVWGSSSSDVFAVGNRGTILHYSGPGSTPTPTATPTATATVTATPTATATATASVTTTPKPTATATATVSSTPTTTTSPTATPTATTRFLIEVGYIFDDYIGGDAQVLKSPKGVFVAGEYAYVASNGDCAMSIIDISDPANPVEVGYIQDDSKGGNGTYMAAPYSIFVRGDYAYYPSWAEDALTIINVSDPINPREVGSVRDARQPGGTAERLDGALFVDVAGNYAYVTTDKDWGLTIINISDPTHPFEVGHILDEEKGGTAEGMRIPAPVFVSGGYAYIGSMGDDAISIIDISDPANPVQVGVIYDDESPQEGITPTAKCLDLPIGIYISGKYAYIGSRHDSALSILDISDPTNPIEVGCIQDDDPVADDDDMDYPDGEAHALYMANQVWVAGNYIYVVSYEGALSMIDVSDPTNPVEVDFIKDDSQGGIATAIERANRLHVQGRYAYVTGYYDHSLSVIQLPTASATPTPTPRPGDANGDGAIDAADITKLERIILEWDAETPGADANEDGEVNTTDIGVVEYMILGIWPWNHVHIKVPDNLPYCTHFVATVFITYVEDFGSAGFEVIYNSSVLDLVDVKNGRLMEINPGVSTDFYTVNVTDWSQPGGPGTLLVNVSIDGNPGPDGAGYLARLQFHVIGSAGQASPIAFNVPQSWMKDNVGGDITATWEDDSVTVAP